MATNRLTQSTIDEIQRRLAAGETYHAIKDTLGVSLGVIAKYNKLKINKINDAAQCVASAQQIVESFCESDRDAIISRAANLRATADADKSARQYASNIRLLLNRAAFDDLANATQSQLTDPDFLAPRRAALMTASEAGKMADSIADLEHKTGNNKSDLDNMSAEELRAELRRLGNG